MLMEMDGLAPKISYMLKLVDRKKTGFTLRETGLQLLEMCFKDYDWQHCVFLFRFLD